jgi:hypothetical protein
MHYFTTVIVFATTALLLLSLYQVSCQQHSKRTDKQSAYTICPTALSKRKLLLFHITKLRFPQIYRNMSLRTSRCICEMYCSLKEDILNCCVGTSCSPLIDAHPLHSNTSYTTRFRLRIRRYRRLTYTETIYWFLR